MKQILLMIAVVGCGEAEHEAAPMVQAEQEDLLTYEDSEEAKADVVINAPPPERSLEVQFLDGELKKADLEEVTKLNLDGYQLTELPKNLENLTQLKVLVLSKNQLAGLPKGLEKLTQLEELNLGFNQLTDVKGLENLKQLRWLWLNDNQLTDVKGLENLTQLQKLYLNNNDDLTKTQITELQKALPKCKLRSNAKK